MPAILTTSDGRVIYSTTTHWTVGALLTRQVPTLGAEVEREAHDIAPWTLIVP